MTINVFQTGWGVVDNFRERSDSLLEVDLKVQPISACRNELEDDIISEVEQICAGRERKKDTCTGDR